MRDARRAPRAAPADDLSYTGSLHEDYAPLTGKPIMNGDFINRKYIGAQPDPGAGGKINKDKTETPRTVRPRRLISYCPMIIP